MGGSIGVSALGELLLVSLLVLLLLLLLLAVPFAALALRCVLSTREVPLRTTVDLAEEAAPAATEELRSP